MKARKAKGAKKAKKTARKTARAVVNRVARRHKLPKPIKEKVAEIAEKEGITENDVQVIRPTRTDPVVRVKDRVVGAWVDL